MKKINGKYYYSSNKMKALSDRMESYRNRFLSISKKNKELQEEINRLKLILKDLKTVDKPTISER